MARTSLPLRTSRSLPTFGDASGGFVGIPATFDDAPRGLVQIAPGDPRSVHERPRAARCGYTTGMKTAVSIPDEIFQRAERLAKRNRRSRSELYAAALDEYVARHSPDEVTDVMNRVCERVGDEKDEFITAVGQRTFDRIEW